MLVESVDTGYLFTKFLYVARARKDDKIRQNAFFHCYKKINLVPNKQLVPNVQFQSTKNRKKELCVDNKVRETIVDVYCPTCRNEKLVYFATKKSLIFTTVKSGKPAATI